MGLVRMFRPVIAEKFAERPPTRITRLAEDRKSVV